MVQKVPNLWKDQFYEIREEGMGIGQKNQKRCHFIVIFYYLSTVRVWTPIFTSEIKNFFFYF